MLPGIVGHWTAQISDNLQVVVTGKQRLHYLARHPETESLEPLLQSCVLEPDEVHRDQRDALMAIFYKAIGAGRYVRVAVLMQIVPNWRKHSIMSYRLANAAELRKHRDLAVWSRG